ncbi:ABC transporter permease [Hyalangium sp.]|uniref:ABC transporter permease n=1 Tax=Hyalangium sp. TaxID=2028555 RepID=UPI002D580A4F|nr:ABC transporter permease [Hyalangium sp.]HYH97698.1 ABC transporter permease [Hyalangium sp.]
MAQLLQDVRLALRLMRRERVFTLMVVATLALAIGASTSVFSVVYQVLLRPLPYTAPEQLVRVHQSVPQRERIGVSYPALRAWRERSRTFAGFEGLAIQDLTLTGDEGAEQVRAGRATAGLLPMLGVQPVLGRAFDEEAEVPGRDRVVLLTHALWQRRFGQSPGVIGQTLTLNGQPHTVLAVLPASFQLAPDVELWKPLAPDLLKEVHNPQNNMMRVVGRLRPGVTLEQARVDMDELAAALTREEAYAGDATGVRLVPLHAQVVEGVRDSLWLLAGVGALVLLVACANVANLLLARASARAREVSVRAALGAGRAQLLQQFLVESTLLALAGGAAGLLLVLWSVDLLRALIPQEVLPQGEVQLEGHVLAIAAGLSLLTSFLFGLVPALRTARANGRGALGDLRGARGTTGSGGARAALVVAQVALALVPLVGAGLMLRTLRALHEVPLGFEPRGVTVAELYLAGDAYADEARRHLLFTELLERVRALPGVQAAGLASTVPLWGNTGVAVVLHPGEDIAVAATRELTNFHAVSEGYLAAMGMSLKEGRLPEAADGPGAPPVMLVNEAFARRDLPGRGALGQRARLEFEGEPFREVVGVVGDVRQDALGETPVAAVYLPMGQFLPRRMVLAVRTTGDAAALTAALREQLRGLAPDVPLVKVRSLEEVVRASYGRTEVLGALLAALAALGLALAGVGLYGVLAYSVSQRTRELGIRVALGATDHQVLRLVISQGMRLAAVGVVVGLVGAGLLARGLAGMLYGVEVFDPLTFAAVPALLGAVALLASWLPARRALRVPAHEALRSDG